MRRFTWVVHYLVALAFILALVFVLPRAMPGDPLQAIYGGEALVQMTPQLQADLVQRFALDKSIWQQLPAYFAALFRGDLGYSYYYNAPVSSVILGALPWTLLLAGSALVLSTVLGILFGIESGWRRGRRSDRTLLSAFVAISGFPDFFIGILALLLFGVTLRLLPLAGAITPYARFTGPALIKDIVRHLILPLASLTLVQVAGPYLLTRNTMITNLKEPFVMTAKAKGLSDRIVRYRHAGRNSLLPVVSRTGIRAGLVVTGTLFVEIVFSYPGLGSLVYNALFTRDYPLIQGIFLIVAVAVLGANLLADLSYRRLDPRVRVPCT